MEQFYAILWTSVGTIVTALIGWLTTMISKWIADNIKDKKMANHAASINLICMNAVQCVSQTFVDTMKKNGKFDEEAQKEAKERAKVIIESQLTTELKEYITENFGDIKEFISNKIESTIYTLKK